MQFNRIETYCMAFFSQMTAKRADFASNRVCSYIINIGMDLCCVWLSDLKKGVICISSDLFMVCWC